MRRAQFWSFQKRAPVGWFAPSYRMLSDNYRQLNDLLAPVVVRRRNNERLDFMGGGYIDFWSLENPDRARGRKYRHIIINEAAMVDGLSDAWSMVLRPMLADLKGGADFASTPKGLNAFYNLYQLCADDKDWASFYYTTYDNPFIDPAEIDELKRTLPERVYQQEIMAEFVEDGAFFQNINNAAVIEQPDRPDDHKNHTTVMGVDWAKHQDFAALTVACAECNRVVDWERFNQIDYIYQRERTIRMANKWGASLLPERNSIGEPNIEILMQHVNVLQGPDGNYGFYTTATTKPLLIQKLAVALEYEGLLVPADYADELRSYQLETTLSGHTKFNAPAGQHDDRVISLALAWWAMSGGSWLLS